MLTWLRCKLFLHRWQRLETDDGERYDACRDCRAIKDVAGVRLRTQDFLGP